MEKLNTVLGVLYESNGTIKFPFTYTSSMSQQSVDCLPLDTRSSNGLKRNYIRTMGELIDTLNNGGISTFKGMGKKSINRISYELCAYQYKQTSKEKRDNFLMSIIKMNTK